jgi:probable rRNA maturation factor
MEQTTVLINCPSRYKIDRAKTRKIVKQLLHRYGMRRPVEVGLTLVGDRKMRFLNRTYRGQNRPVAILSFPLMTEGERFYHPPGAKIKLGDVVISYPQLLERARQGNVLVAEEFANLLEHGIKNLLEISVRSRSEGLKVDH